MQFADFNDESLGLLSHSLQLTINLVRSNQFVYFLCRETFLIFY